MVEEAGSISGALMPVGAIFKRSWEAYKTRAKSVILVMLAGMLIVAAAGILSFLPVAIYPYHLVSSVLVIAFSIVTIVAVFWSQAAVIYAASSRGLGVKGSLGAAWRRLPGFIWLLLLLGFVIYGGLALLIVPGIILMILTYFTLFVLVNEDRRGMDAMVACWEYVRGRWWAVFGRICLLTILYMVLVGGPMQVMAVIAPAMRDPGSVYVLLAFMGAIMLLAVFVVIPYMIVFMNELYEDLRATKLPAPEGFARKARFRAIGAGIVGSLILVLLLVVSIAIPQYARMQTLKYEQFTYALQDGDMEYAESFLRDNPGAVSRQYEGQSPLHLAVISGNPDMVKLILDNGADPNVANYETTPLVIAFEEWDRFRNPERLDIMRLLMEHGADPNRTNSDGNAPLLFLAYYGETDMVRLFIEKGADVNAVNEYGETPLIGAVAGSQPEAAALLIEHGADVNRKTTEGETPMSLARTSGNAALIDMLEKAGAQ